MSEPTVYLETTVIGHLVGRLHPDPVVCGRQIITREWWALAPGHFRLLVSKLVEDECGEGDKDAASERLAIVKDCEYIPSSHDAESLAKLLILRSAIPPTEPRDALHIPIAAVNSVQYLVTWNFRHIANPVTKELIEQTCRESHFEPPIICTPDELAGALDA